MVVVTLGIAVVWEKRNERGVGFYDTRELEGVDYEGGVEGGWDEEEEEEDEEQRRLELLCFNL